MIKLVKSISLSLILASHTFLIYLNSSNDPLQSKDSLSVFQLVDETKNLLAVFFAQAQELFGDDIIHQASNVGIIKLMQNMRDVERIRKHLFLKSRGYSHHVNKQVGIIGDHLLKEYPEFRDVYAATVRSIIESAEQTTIKSSDELKKMQEDYEIDHQKCLNKIVKILWFEIIQPFSLLLKYAQDNNFLPILITNHKGYTHILSIREIKKRVTTLQRMLQDEKSHTIIENLLYDSKNRIISFKKFDYIQWWEKPSFQEIPGTSSFQRENQQKLVKQNFEIGEDTLKVLESNLNETFKSQQPSPEKYTFKETTTTLKESYWPRIKKFFSLFFSPKKNKLVKSNYDSSFAKVVVTNNSVEIDPPQRTPQRDLTYAHYLKTIEDTNGMGLDQEYTPYLKET